jgi:predicted DCC family thiol-disulfide oxidoreductase YuxK
MPESFSKHEVRLQTFLLYDSQCGPCTTFMKIVTGLDFRKKMTPISIHGTQAENLVRGLLSNSRLKSSFHIVEVSAGTTQVYSAGDALVRLTRYAPAGSLNYAIISRIKPLRQLLRWSYFQAARMRSASKSCSVVNISR